jgi:hypothetical protein
MSRQIELEETLNSFDSGKRRKALEKLAGKFMVESEAEPANVNMHFHSFFSYNSEGWSPSRIAWEARKAGLYAAGLCDFDVLDGLEEFLQAGPTLRLRTTVNIETRAFFKEYANVEISSPGEPGVTYIMGAGFVRMPAAGSAQATGLTGYRDRAKARNLALIQRINARLPEIALDYDEDVLPLTPAGGATERHIVTAYISKSKMKLENAEAAAKFWTGVLGKKSLEDVVMLMADTPAFEEVVRSKLAKRGGIGYEQPSVGTFPPVDEFISWVLSCRAIPMITWLDGTSAGEQNGRAMLECMQAKGAAALNIIPDRNWNISNLEIRAVETANLKAIVEAADSLHLPINIGTEMNKTGLPFVDDLESLSLKPYAKIFLRGARIMVGHTRLFRYADLSYVGPKAAAEFKDTAAKNTFFETVGALPPLDERTVKHLTSMGPDKALAWFREAAGKARPA